MKHIDGGIRDADISTVYMGTGHGISVPIFRDGRICCCDVIFGQSRGKILESLNMDAIYRASGTTVRFF